MLAVSGPRSATTSPLRRTWGAAVPRQSSQETGGSGNVGVGILLGWHPACMASRYFRRRWDESRGDQFDSWGPAVYFFEVDEDLNPTRQIEVYEGGQRLRYGRDRVVDGYGMLSDQPLDLADFAPFEIPSAEFDEAWSAGPVTNPQP
jgi:hypothetical protein